VPMARIHVDYLDIDASGRVVEYTNSEVEEPWSAIICMAMLTAVCAGIACITIVG
jgi:hypothetical protein